MGDFAGGGSHFSGGARFGNRPGFARAPGFGRAFAFRQHDGRFRDHDRYFHHRFARDRFFFGLAIRIPRTRIPCTRIFGTPIPTVTGSRIIDPGLLRGCLKSPDSRQIRRVCAHSSFRTAGVKPIPHSVRLALAGLFKHPLRTFPRPRRYPRRPRCRSALGSPLYARPARRY